MMRWYMKWIIYELRIWNQVKLWSSQLWTQFLQLRREAWKIHDFNAGFEPVTSRFRCDALTNWAMKPLTLGVGHLWVLMVPWGMNQWWDGIWNKSYMNCGYEIKWSYDLRSYEGNFNCEDHSFETRQRSFKEGTVYLLTTEPRAFTTACILNCSVSVDYLEQKRTAFRALTMKWRVWKRAILYSLYSMTRTNYAAKIPLSSFFKPIAHKCYISSFKLQFPPPHAGKDQISLSTGNEDSQMPGLCRGGGGGGNVEVSIWSARNNRLDKLRNCELASHAS